MPAGQHRLFHSGLFRVETSPACFFSPATLSSLLSSPLLRRGSSRDIAAHACRNDPLWCCFSSVPMLITALLGSLAGTPSVRVSFPMLFHFFFYFLSEDTLRSIIGSARMRVDVLWRLLVEVVGLFWLVMEEEEEEGDGREVVVDGRVIAG